ncbi:TolC family outer membrane protein [Aquisalimonas lutea]|uniref:TolC family outer membrane protein n=1 Tax=Aquisalimonas lutea TaxID=1327750 RepID=UPI0025B2F924|nr:TolC family outer membrane protein [Aquisalimonas lutea]MDN3518807.1 TolC family outer membrane protein [Aquisalimonas lutea]
MRALTRSLGLALCLAGPLLAGSQGAAADDRLDLSEAYRLAIDRDPQLRAARARLRASEELDAQSRALFLPDVNLEAGANRNWENSEVGSAPRQSVEYDSWSAGVSVTQPLFRKESFAVADQNEILQNQAGLEYARSQQDILLRVSQAYFDMLLAQDTLELTDAELEAVESELERAERELEVGSGTVTDRDAAQARYDRVQADRLQARNQLQIARENLRSLIGRRPGDIAGLREDFAAQTPSPDSAEAWAERARRNNLNVRLAESEFRRSRTEIRRLQGERYPQVDLVASYGRNYQDDRLAGSQPGQIPGEVDSEQAAVGLSVTMPLYTGGAASSRVRQARAERDAFFEESVDAKREASLDAESAYLNLVSSLRRIGALEQALESARSTERSTRRGLEVGLRTTLDLLNVQRDRFATQRDLAEARYNYLLNYLELQVAVGSGIDGSTVDDVNYFLANSEQQEREIESLVDPAEAEPSNGPESSGDDG